MMKVLFKAPLTFRARCLACIIDVTFISLSLVRRISIMLWETGHREKHLVLGAVSYLHVFSCRFVSSCPKNDSL